MKKENFLGLSILVTFQCFAAQTPSFQGLGPLSATYQSSRAFDVSADGSTVVGTVGTTDPYANAKAFRWTQSTGMFEIAPTYAYANGVSANGNVITGARNSNQMGFVWTDGYGIQDIPKLLSSTSYAMGRKVSDNGQCVVGVTNLPGSGYGQAYRWTIGGQIESLGDLPGGTALSDAFGISSDGSIVVGWAEGYNRRQAYRWTQSDGMVAMELMNVPDMIRASNATAVSADGNVIVGYIHCSYNRYAFRWTASGGMVDLGTLATGSRDDTAMDISGDGSIIVGYGAGAWIWDESNGMRNLQTVLTSNYGLDLSGWQLTLANAISNDGRAIVGWGINPNGIEEGWIAIIPEPATLSLFALGAILAGRKRKA